MRSEPHIMARIDRQPALPRKLRIFRRAFSPFMTGISDPEMSHFHQIIYAGMT